MDFLSWHYSRGVNFYLQHWIFYIRWIAHYFSLPLLFNSLFAPWKRLVIEEKVGINPEKLLEKLTFNMISRGIGATVRILLFLLGILVLFWALLLGALGFLIWFICPLAGLPFYLRQKQGTTTLVENLQAKIRAVSPAALGTSPQQIVSTIFDNEAGKFVLSHAGVDFADLGQNYKMKPDALTNLSPKSYQDLVNWFVLSFVNGEEYFKIKGTSTGNMLAVAGWWDEKKTRFKAEFGKMYFGRPGIGLELLFGYTPNLDNYVVDLATPQPYSHHWIGREQIVNRIERALTSGDCVLIMGQPGVGKTTVVLEFARRASLGLLGPEMAYKRVLEFNYNLILAQTKDLNLKKTLLGALLDEAKKAGNIILVIRDIQRLTNLEVEGYDFTDVFESFLEGGKGLKIIGIASSVDYERFIAPNLKLGKHFLPVEVVAPSKEEAMKILMMAAEEAEVRKKMIITVPALQMVLEGSDRYITEVPFPEKALELMDEAVVYAEPNGSGILTTKDVEAVLSEKTGISFGQLTESVKDKLSRLEEIMHERLVDQELAIDLVAKSLRGRTVGVKAGNRPVGSFLFLGPTGVGKTETAKVLARVYFGSQENILRFDMAEYAGPEGLSRLIGTVARNLPGSLTTAIKNRPASLLLLDEIEKAPPQVYNLFLALLDEGVVTDAFNKKISCQNLFVIATSNAGAEYTRELVNGGIKGETLQKAVVDYIQKQGFFSPEFLNRFDGVVVFEPLKKEDLTKIARLQLEELKSELEKKNIYLEIDEGTCAKLAEDGYDPPFGARPMRRIIELVLGDLLGKAILKGEIQMGDRIKILPGAGKEEYKWEKISN